MLTVNSVPALAQPLTINYGITGTAALGLDYSLSGNVGQIVIPAGQTSASIMLTGMNNPSARKAKTAKFTLSPNSTYTVPKKIGKSASVKIRGR